MDPSEIPNFVVPFPPEITPEEVFSKRSLKKLQSRPPNRFFIYRSAYLKELRKLINIKKLSMTKLSPFISKSWCAERVEVKEEYRKLADKVGDLLNTARRESFVLITENPGFRSSTPPAPPAEPESQPPVISYSEQEIFNLYFGL